MAGSDDSPAGASRLLGVNQLQSGLDKLTSAVQALTSKLGGTGGAPTGSGATFSNTGSFSTPNGGGSGFSIGRTLNAMSSGGNGGWASAIGGAVGGAMGGGLGALAGGTAGSNGGPLIASSAYQNTYATINAYQAAMTMGLTGGAYNRALGLANNLGGFGSTPLITASSAMDAASGMSALIANSGSLGGSSLNARGVNMYGMAGGLGITNPGMSFGQGAATASQFYSPQTSLQMRMMGFGSTPLTMGGGTNGSAQVLGGMMNRWFGSSSVSASKLGYNLGSNGEITQQLALMGITGTSANAMENQLRAYNSLAGKGWNAGQINSIFSGANTGNRSALAHLRAAGVDVSTITQQGKTGTAIGTQRAGGQTTDYARAYADASTAVNQFNEALTKVTNGPLKWLSDLGAGASGFRAGLNPSSSGGAATSSSGGFSSTPSTSSTSVVSGAAKSAIGWAEKEIGVPYKWGGEQPGVGFDCSGLTQWAYKQAGVNIPRTSQQQWASLSKGHSVPLNAVQAGDLVFTAGSDGTASAPGHVAMMVSSNQLIEAEETGTRIKLVPYNANGWQHAARPSGSGVSGSSNAGTGASGGTTHGLTTGTAGGYTDASLSSMSESSALQSGGLLSGMLGNTGFSGTGASGTGSAGTGNAAGGSSTSPMPLSGTAGSIEALMKSMAAGAPWKWTGSQWTDLYNVEMREAGFNLNAKNPSSGAYGLAQFINGPGEYAQYGGNANTESGQITGFLNYVLDRYKTPASAWAHEEQFGWYGRGTQNASPGLAVVGENGPEIVNMRGGEQVATAGQTAGLLAGIQSGQGTGGVSINVTVAQGAVTMNGAGGGNVPPGTPALGASDVQSVAQALGEQIGDVLAHHEMMQKLRAGVS